MFVPGVHSMTLPGKSKRKSRNRNITFDSPAVIPAGYLPDYEVCGRLFSLQLRCRSEYLGSQSESSLDSVPSIAGREYGAGHGN